MARLRIDTSIERLAGPSSAGPSSRSRSRNATPASSHGNSLAVKGQRLRSPSTASTSSSLSVISPMPESATGSASSSSVNLATVSTASSETPSGSRSHSFASDVTYDTRATSPETDETAGHVSSGDYVLAMHDFTPQHQNATCLSFRAGQVIHVLNRDATGWWDGELDGRRGWFPSNYVSADVSSIMEEASPVKPVCRNILSSARWC
jgi:son of sevenless